MISAIENESVSNSTLTTSKDARNIWGMSHNELYSRFWQTHNIQIIRKGEPQKIHPSANFFFLTSRKDFLFFDPIEMKSLIEKSETSLTRVMFKTSFNKLYSEKIVQNTKKEFSKFTRQYCDTLSENEQVVLTSDKRRALFWMSDTFILSEINKKTTVLHGSAIQVDCREDRNLLVQHIMSLCDNPCKLSNQIIHLGGDTWSHKDNLIEDDIKLFGRIWIGKGWKLQKNDYFIGTTALYDQNFQEDKLATDQQKENSNSESFIFNNNFEKPHEWVCVNKQSLFSRFSKRLFDICFSLVALCVTLPFYPLIILLIWLEDGFPIFFSHERETLKGKIFPCYKFRTMKKNADEIKKELEHMNQVDGPQFYIKKDPRLTNIGRWLRDLQVDEWPQFFNVLLGQMSIVGPRPSPFSENQFCPTWREARLSVRPGIAGLWQVERSRVAGQDFQEWIKYDIQYVENISFLLDIKIICKAAIHVVSTIVRKLKF